MMLIYSSFLINPLKNFPEAATVWNVLVVLALGYTFGLALPKSISRPAGVNNLSSEFQIVLFGHFISDTNIRRFLYLSLLKGVQF